MFNTTKAATNESSASKPKSKSILLKLVDWLYGDASAREELGYTNEPTADLPVPKITVGPPVLGGSWTDAFKLGITEATAQFIRDHVDCFYADDNTVRFSISRLVVHYDEPAAPIVRPFRMFPSTMQNGQTVRSMEKARLSNRLVFDEFYGTSFAGAATIADGQLVEVLVSAGGASANIHFGFEGSYIRVEEAVQAVATPEPAAEPVTASEELSIANTPSNRPCPVHLQMDMIGQSPTRTITSIQQPSAANERRKTPMNLGRAPMRKPFAFLRLRARGKEASVDLYEDMLPYTIGRNETFVGFACVPNGADPFSAKSLLADAEEEDKEYFASRKHIVLQKVSGGVLYIDNLVAASATTGTFEKGSVGKFETKGKRFVYALADAPWLALGVEEGDGALEVRMEAA